MYIKAKKSLGQNFLKDKNIVEDIVTAGEVKALDFVIEIGPGKGILTEILLEKGANVLAIEKDQRLIEPLKEKFAKYISNKKLNIIEGDILEIDIKDLLKRPNLDNNPIENTLKYKLIANIPYYITGQILEKFLSNENPPSLAVLMLQKEVAKRITDKKESILSLSIKVYGEPKIERIVKAESFIPAPKVDSAILSIKNINKNRFSNTESEKRFFEIVKTAFKSKRKKVKSNLTGLFEKEKIDAIIWKELGIDENERAENIPLEKWLKITTLH